MGCRKSFRIFLKAVISLACILVCSYQVYIVGVLYLSYPTTVDLRVGRSLNVHLPGITICTEISATILSDKIMSIQPSLFHVLHGKTQRQVSYLLRKKTFRELLEEPLRGLPINLQHKYTIGADKFFDKCQVPTPIGYQKGYSYSYTYTTINCSAISEIVETISYDTKCYTLFYNNVNEYKQNNYKIKRDSANLKNLAWIRINRDYVLNGLIYIHTPTELHQYSDGNNVLQINPNGDQFIGITFTRQSTRLLPPPYATQCKNYTLFGFTSREHCLADCKVNAYTNADGWPGDIFATKNITYSFSKLWMNAKSPAGHLEEGLSLDEMCRQKCGEYENCMNTFYEVKQLRAVERDEEDYENSDWMTIAIMPPKTVDMTLVHLPKYEPIELAIYVGGLVSLYLGVSVVSVIVAMFAFITFTSKKPTFVANKKPPQKPSNVEMKNMNKSTNSVDIESNNNNNNTYSLVPTNPENVVRQPPEPRARLPGLLYFMFET